MTAPFTMGSLFDGIGGFPYAGLAYGFAPVWASEIEPFGVRVTQAHFPGMGHRGDITRINGAELEPVDLVCGGSPCQDLSVAGKRKGLKHAALGDGIGTRSGLYMEQIRIIKEMRQATNGKHPQFMVWENVPGALSSNGGEDFRAVLEEACHIADETVSIPRPAKERWATTGSIVGDDYSVCWWDGLQTLVVRRLTPLECERLQGFPDGWTAIPGASDSARYKALGNSVAIPCVEYVLEGIALVLWHRKLMVA